MSSSPLKSHPECDLEGSEVVRIISGGSGLIFKGSGFYSTIKISPILKKTLRRMTQKSQPWTIKQIKNK
jgi:hypothetical protein